MCSVDTNNTKKKLTFKLQKLAKNQSMKALHASHFFNNYSRIRCDVIIDLQRHGIPSVIMCGITVGGAFRRQKLFKNVNYKNNFTAHNLSL